MKKKELASDEMKIAAEDGAFVYHAVQHNYSFHQPTVKSVIFNLSKGPV